MLFQKVFRLLLLFSFFIFLIPWLRSGTDRTTCNRFRWGVQSRSDRSKSNSSQRASAGLGAGDLLPDFRFDLFAPYRFQSLSHQRSLRDSVGRWSETSRTASSTYRFSGFQSLSHQRSLRDSVGRRSETDPEKGFNTEVIEFQSLSHQRSLRDSVGRRSETFAR